MNLNSFDDVAKHFANENNKLSDRIVDGFKTELAKIRNDMKGDLDTLSHNVHESVQKVEDEQSTQKLRIAELEDTVARMQRMSELVISGIPFTTNESCVNILLNIGSVINCQLNGSAVRAFRLNKTGQNNNKRLRDSDSVISPIIMVKFPSTAEKNDFFSKYLARKNLNLTDIGFKAPHRIYVKENLTPYNYKIFQACENAKRAGLINKFFTRDGTCHMTLKPNGKTIMVQSLEFFHETVNMNYNDNRPARHTKVDGRKIPKKQRKVTQPTGNHNTRSSSTDAHSADKQSWSSLAQSSQTASQNGPSAST